MARKATPKLGLDWPMIIDEVRRIVEDYNTRDLGITLRGLFYRLVSVELLPTRLPIYQTLSGRTAKLRREGEFPSLVDRTRRIHRLGAT